MRQTCSKCSRNYDDEFCSTSCPHRGIGFCAVCDCAVCVCTPETAGDPERSSVPNIGDGGNDGDRGDGDQARIERQDRSI
jgi:hypothetical protein